jgi:hypothetical protein
MRHMAEPLLSQVRCPECGAAGFANSVRCWLCGKTVYSGDRATTAANPAAIARPSPAKGYTSLPDEPRPFQFSIGSVLIVTTLIAACLGALLAAPGLGGMLILFLGLAIVPAAVRACIIRARLAEEPEGVSSDPHGLVFFSSLAITAAALAMGFVVCGIVAFAALWVSSRDHGRDSMVEGVMTILFLASPLIGLASAGILYWLTLPQGHTPP